MNEKVKEIFYNKVQYHKENARLPFEEKYKIIISLQKIDLEFRKKPGAKMLWYYKVWQSYE